jgi:hypothetical protein
MDKIELRQILNKHKKWQLSEDGGKRANLRYADLSSANLSSANLNYANLRYADLSSANLRYADLRYADLNNTNLDPMVSPNGKIETFELIDDDQWAIGYRTSNSPQMGGANYTVGELKEAPIFSTSKMECHPGIFVLPTIEQAREWGDKVVKVIFRPWECHRAGKKWRVRWLIVWSEVQ